MFPLVSVEKYLNRMEWPYSGPSSPRCERHLIEKKSNRFNSDMKCSETQVLSDTQHAQSSAS